MKDFVKRFTLNQVANGIIRRKEREQMMQQEEFGDADIEKYFSELCDNVRGKTKTQDVEKKQNVEKKLQARATRIKEDSFDGKEFDKEEYRKFTAVEPVARPNFDDARNADEMHGRAMEYQREVEKIDDRESRRRFFDEIRRHMLDARRKNNLDERLRVERHVENDVERTSNVERRGRMW